MIGTLVSQLLYVDSDQACDQEHILILLFYSRLQHAPSPDPHFGFYVLGKPLAIICHGSALVTIALGAFKTWRTQNAIARGKALAGGFEILLVGAGIFVVSPGDIKVPEYLKRAISDCSPP